MLLRIGCGLSFTENLLLASTICSFRRGELSESRGTKLLAAFLRWLNKSSNAQAAQLKSYCGLTIARWNDFSIPTSKVARSLTEPKAQRGLPLRARLYLKPQPSGNKCCCKCETLFHSRAKCAMLAANLRWSRGVVAPVPVRKGAEERDVCHG